MWAYTYDTCKICVILFDVLVVLSVEIQVGWMLAPNGLDREAAVDQATTPPPVLLMSTVIPSHSLLSEFFVLLSLFLSLFMPLPLAYSIPSFCLSVCLSISLYVFSIPSISVSNVSFL